MKRRPCPACERPVEVLVEGPWGKFGFPELCTACHELGPGLPMSILELFEPRPEPALPVGRIRRRA